MKRILLSVLVLMLSLGLSAERKALVIGNAVYQGNSLASPINDSNDMESALGNWGFSVRKALNLNLQSMTAVVDSFAAAITPEDEVFFYYSGHGTRDDGGNYLVPAGINMQNRQVYARTAYSVNRLIQKLNRAKSTIILLEASRHWPPVSASSAKFFENMAVHDSTVSVIMSAKPNTTVSALNPERSAFTQAFIQKFTQSEDSYNQTILSLQQELQAVPSRPINPWISLRGLLNNSTSISVARGLD